MVAGSLVAVVFWYDIVAGKPSIRQVEGDFVNDLVLVVFDWSQTNGPLCHNVSFLY